MSAGAQETAVLSGYGTARDLLRLQRLADSSLVLSLTRKCPLSCGHCITSSSPGAAGPVLSRATADLWARDLPRMAEAGLRHLTLTGGEPILALDALGVLVRGARGAGVDAYVVTSAAWATTPRAAAGVVARAGPVSGWDIGTDAWHAEEMPLDRIGCALDAIGETEARVTIRMCAADDAAADAAALAALSRIVAGRAPILRQSVRAIGRATGREGHEPATGLPRRPCISTGLFVRADGSTGPCCAGLAYEAVGDHPFDYGRIDRPGDLLAAWQRWRADPLLRVMRLSALAALEGWLPDRLRGGSAPPDPCEACVGLWSKMTASERDVIAARSRRREVTDKLAALERALAPAE